mmetsp:Transcript_22373/g.53604  ORF Transcript_22373/g.53604 Transcript_22373/m.53604 type:complete len:279 (-) Transcript_22373:111-947(-)
MIVKLPCTEDPRLSMLSGQSNEKLLSKLCLKLCLCLAASMLLGSNLCLSLASGVADTHSGTLIELALLIARCMTSSPVSVRRNPATLGDDVLRPAAEGERTTPPPEGDAALPAGDLPPCCCAFIDRWNGDDGVFASPGALCAGDWAGGVKLAILERAEGVVGTSGNASPKMPPAPDGDLDLSAGVREAMRVTEYGVVLLGSSAGLYDCSATRSSENETAPTVERIRGGLTRLWGLRAGISTEPILAWRCKVHQLPNRPSHRAASCCRVYVQTLSRPST